jgi:hypothetical protein
MPPGAGGEPCPGAAREPRRVLDPLVLAEFTSRYDGVASRALGGTRLRASLRPVTTSASARSDTPGFTGTSLWLDPSSTSGSCCSPTGSTRRGRTRSTSRSGAPCTTPWRSRSSELVHGARSRSSSSPTWSASPCGARGSAEIRRAAPTTSSGTVAPLARRDALRCRHRDEHAHVPEHPWRGLHGKPRLSPAHARIPAGADGWCPRCSSQPTTRLADHRLRAAGAPLRARRAPLHVGDLHGHAAPRRLGQALRHRDPARADHGLALPGLRSP